MHSNKCAGKHHCILFLVYFVCEDFGRISLRIICLELIIIFEIYSEFDWVGLHSSLSLKVTRDKWNLRIGFTSHSSREGHSKNLRREPSWARFDLSYPGIPLGAPLERGSGFPIPPKKGPRVHRGTIPVWLRWLGQGVTSHFFVADCFLFNINLNYRSSLPGFGFKVLAMLKLGRFGAS